jgi:hypothetical protein
MGEKSGSGSAGMNNPVHISESLETICWVEIFKKIFCGSGIQDGKKFGSGINIPDPQYFKKAANFLDVLQGAAAASSGSEDNDSASSGSVASSGSSSSSSLGGGGAVQRSSKPGRKPAKVEWEKDPELYGIR